MNSFSVTGKKWVYKKYNNKDVEFIKDNFFLDETSSRLLAIRKIKHDEIKNYLNPSIKNILPNPNLLFATQALNVANTYYSLEATKEAKGLMTQKQKRNYPTPLPNADD